jgi:regulatory protein
VAEVRGRLERAELAPDEIEAALAELIELGYLDDTRFARLFAQDKRELDGWGSGRISRALLERGIDRELVAETVATAEAGGSEIDRALALLRRRFPQPPRELRDRERALGVLVRKGYDSEVAYDALRAWHAGAVADDD